MNDDDDNDDDDDNNNNINDTEKSLLKPVADTVVRPESVGLPFAYLGNPSPCLLEP